MTAVPDTHPGSDSVAMPPAGRPPSALPAAAPAGVFLALLLLGLGIVALRDTAVALQWLRGTPWIDTVIHGADGGLRFDWVMIPVGIAALAVGLILVVCSVRPRRSTGLAVNAASSVWISPWELAAVSTHAANTVPGVSGARTSATQRALTVSARVADATTADAKTSEVEAAVRDAVGILTNAPKVTIRIQKGGKS